MRPPLIEFLRKSNDNGDIIRHIKEAHQRKVVDAIRLAKIEEGFTDKNATKHGQNILKAYKRQEREAPEQADTLADFVGARTGIDVPELIDFANGYQSQAEKLVAAGTYSMLNDRYFG